MKHKFFLSILLSFYSFAIRSQANEAEVDSILASKITISGFCLCQTKLADLKDLSGDLKTVGVEEMDLGKRCKGGSDSRYENGKGYYSEKYPGLIFQKDDENKISKIRLTKDFTGKLPDGTQINLKTLLLKDVLKIYPALNAKWGSRPCSDFWSFSNDTLAFFVKIDKNKNPQFPIDEKYYLDKPIEGIDLMISCYSLSHKHDNIDLFPLNEPMIFVDSIRLNQKAVENMYQPTEFAFVTVYKDSDATRIAGKEAKNGAIYIITKSFAEEHYWNYFKSKSQNYQKLVPDIETASKVVYILNNKVLENNFDKDLFVINDSSFIDLTVIDIEKLKSDYKILDKSIGVIIRTK
jgi:hypothetical protein